MQAVIPYSEFSKTIYELYSELLKQNKAGAYCHCLQLSKIREYGPLSFVMNTIAAACMNSFPYLLQIAFHLTIHLYILQ
jgi:hypothetical protein